ncbi:MAG: D-2-hydroxyacid dehydrogenase [Acidimicrobiales bacterium]|nr:D-2-hydroxyacid dehydrogenase [Acidimicrobiales bacterium]
MSGDRPLTAAVLAVGNLVGADVVADLGALLPGVDVRWSPYTETIEQRVERRRLRRAGRPLERTELSDALRETLLAADAVLAFDVPWDLTVFAPRLRLLQAVGAGVEQYDHAGLAAHGVTLCNAAGIAAPSMAEYVIGRLLEVYKGSRAVEQLQRDRRWKRHETRELAGATVAIVGLGAIGRATAQRLRGWEVTLLGVRRRVDPAATDPDVDEVFAVEDLDLVLGRADVVVLTVPATEATNRWFDADRFAAMKPGAVFCNVSRGSMVDEEALRTALEGGRLGAAILDVTRVEPLPAEDPLWGAPNLYLTPHSSTSVDRYAPRLLRLYADNVTRLAEGRPLRNRIDPELGYRV